MAEAGISPTNEKDNSLKNENDISPKKGKDVWKSEKTLVQKWKRH